MKCMFLYFFAFFGSCARGWVDCHFHCARFGFHYRQSSKRFFGQGQGDRFGLDWKFGEEGGGLLTSESK
jgi:hypothetical protein